ncbi:MAG TPA: FAD-dependent oxidoreductase [Desulfoprunum sp.]|nr:FAD-dependent oxidoreductase [Desulfoprunum sp.]
MKRDLSLLRDHNFDAVVIGGGIHGAAVFHRLAAAGLKIALLEKNDFGSGTSANSLKILHSGLRYLQHLNFQRIR